MSRQRELESELEWSTRWEADAQEERRKAVGERDTALAEVARINDLVRALPTFLQCAVAMQSEGWKVFSNMWASKYYSGCSCFLKEHSVTLRSLEIDGNTYTYGQIAAGDADHEDHLAVPVIKSVLSGKRTL